MKKLVGMFLAGSLAAGAAAFARAEEPAASASAAAPVAAPDFTPKLVGFIQLWHQADGDEGKAARNSFLAQRVRPAVTGKVNDRLSYLAMAEMGDASAGASSGVGAGGGSAQMVDASITYAFSDLLNVRFGQDWYRFSLSGSWQVFRLPLVLRPEVIDGIYQKMGRNGAFAYDRGLYLFGRAKDAKVPFGYTVSMTNGTGINRSDDNAQKDFVGRFSFQPVGQTQLGVSAFRGVSRVGTAAPKNLSESAYGAELYQPLGGWGRFVGEYLTGDYKGDSGIAVAPLEPRGWYAMLGVKPWPKLELLAQYALYEADANTADTTADTTTLGATYTFNDLNNLKVNYLIRDAEARYAATSTAISGGRKPEDLLLVQWQVVFFPPAAVKNFLQPFIY